MAHNHGSVYQVKVIHQDGTEELSEWLEWGDVPYTLASLHKPQATAYWLRERNVTAPFCPLCRDVETAVSEYPLTDHLSLRSHAHDSSYLVLMGAKDSRAVPASEVIPFANEPCLAPSSDVVLVTKPMGGPSATQKLPSQKPTLRRNTPRRVLSRGGSKRIDPLPK